LKSGLTSLLPPRSDSIGKYHFVSVQTSTAFATTFPHIFGTDAKKVAKIPSLIPCAIDQDPYFRVAREVASKLGYQKPALIHAKFFPALQGPGSKMSASIDSSAIFMNDTPKQM
jgi:tryptophanyl-tRNA synthetase